MPDAANPEMPMIKIPGNTNNKQEKAKKPVDLNKKKELNKMEIRHLADQKIEQWILENENLKMNAIAKVKMIQQLDRIREPSLKKWKLNLYKCLMMEDFKNKG